MKPKKHRVLITDLVTNQKEKIEHLHQECLKRAEQLGEQDGGLSLPLQKDNSISPNEKMLKHEYQKLLADCFHQGKPYLDSPHLEFKTIKNQLSELETNKEEILAEEMEILEQKKKDKLQFIEDEYTIKRGEINNHDKFMQRNYMITKQDLQKVQQDVGRQSPIIHFKSTIAYILLLLGIGLCEVPLNLQIFQKFGEAFFITIIMASSLAIAIPVLAHFSGVFIKQRKEKTEYTLFAILCVLLFVVFNFGISIFRTYVLAEHIGQDPDTLSMVIFTCLNLILFIIGLLAAYFSHDESYALEYNYFKFQKEKKKYDKNRKEVEDKLQVIGEEKTEQVKDVHKQYLYEKASINRLKGRLTEKKNMAAAVYDEVLNSFVGLEEYLDASYKTAVEKYRAVNLLHRKDHISPKSWSKGILPLDFKFKESLELDPN